MSPLTVILHQPFIFRQTRCKSVLHWQEVARSTTVLLYCSNLQHATTPTTPTTLATLATLESDMLIYTALEHRDYTGGEGLRLLQNLVQAGATIVHSVGEAVEIVRQKPLNAVQ